MAYSYSLGNRENYSYKKHKYNRKEIFSNVIKYSYAIFKTPGSLSLSQFFYLH